ncbi:ATP-binding protein [Leptolyngbyaceae cyanobacterium CCMR0082]|uniref:ATP-binding protein n=2 Tax=Adonisia turfae TaxID=2950184 RepID=A0A6M0S199_9CYAN|nr:ATP-binding protein [Adonisia turfae]EKV03726.1 anti-sigma regulatory factor (Ser/Thr protein kinase) [Leptolyngbya sp. PCC 7375]MDV3347554.1 ATP-binding protein [Leptothoe sp. LEGE 181152]NEZ59294.1 ATP-binding protein [Adonisia turfae CCMR0081]NEZ62234.1 ATP-binding protein [Adonisia turfae CCMR0082]
MLKQDQLIVQSKLEDLTQVQQWFDRFCSASQLPWLEAVFDQVNLALAEGFTNAVRHAHKGLPADTPIEIDLFLWQEKLEVQVWDMGQPFDPDKLPERKPGTLTVGGYGWFLMRRLADVNYERNDLGRNCLRIVKCSTPS